jgi:uncharacterized zinc-type alcohol dehydrogenase-like protein
VAVGCLVDSCMTCDQCTKGEEQLCRNRATGTYNGRDRITGETTYGGYSDHIVVREAFVLRVPERLDLARAAPLLCAGSPLTRRCGSGRRGQEPGWGSPAWAGSATWPSSWARPWDVKSP